MSFVNEEKQNYFAPFKKHEYIFNNKNESFEKKLESIIDVWKSVGELNLSQFDLRHVVQIMDWAKLHALNIVLTAEWNGFKATHQSRLLQEIEKAQNELLKLNNGFATRCKKLADVVKNPWEDPLLMKLMKTKDAEIGPQEIEFFCMETAYLVSVRLKKLCESQCEDLALNLVTAFMNCYKLSKSQNFNLSASETQMWFIFDIYIALLYKFQERQKIVVLLKELTFNEGLQLVKRFAKKRVKIAKIWKNCHRVAVLAIQMYISQAVVRYTDDLKDILLNYMEIYLNLCNTESLLQDFTNSVRRISNLADAAGLYIFCDVIQKKAGTKLKPFVIEMYIRALTTDMNELERHKDANETEKVTATTSRLAEAFCNMADFMNEHIKAARECVLTAFSLEPTKERLKMIEDLARKSGFEVLDTGQEWKCKLHPPALPSDEITWRCPECGDWMCKPQLNLPKINVTLNEALQNSVLGISESLCDDLVVCLSNPRYQILSWFLPWDDLHRLCIMYLQDPHMTKNFVTELKFVDIDYSIFKDIKREPIDEYAGIERGYEQYLDQDFVSGEESTDSNSEDSLSQDSRPYSLGSDGAGEGPYIPLVPFAPKSDPNTLKSLRMFRPNLKRKDKEPEASTPGKLLKQDPSSSVNSSKTDINTSLSHYLNGVSSISSYPSQNIPNMDTGSSQVPDSKNVKAATLPLLGGQVAKNEIKSIQVHLQPLNLQKLENCSLKPAATPKSQSLCQSNISDIKKELKVRLLNKPLLNGSKESSNSKGNNPPFKDSKIFIKTPSKINQQSMAMKSEFSAQLKQLTVQVPVQEIVRLNSVHQEQAQADKFPSNPPPLQPLEMSSTSRKNTCQRTYPPDPKTFQKKQNYHSNQIQQSNTCTNSEIIQSKQISNSTKREVTPKTSLHNIVTPQEPANQKKVKTCQHSSTPSNQSSTNNLLKSESKQDTKNREKISPTTCSPSLDRTLTVLINRNKPLMTYSSKSNLQQSKETKILTTPKSNQPQLNQEKLTVTEQQQIKPDQTPMTPQAKSDLLVKRDSVNSTSDQQKTIKETTAVQPYVQQTSNCIGQPLLSPKSLPSKTLPDPVVQHLRVIPSPATLNQTKVQPEMEQVEQEKKEILMKSKQQETTFLSKLHYYETKQPPQKKDKTPIQQEYSHELALTSHQSEQPQIKKEILSIPVSNPEEKLTQKLDQTQVKQEEKLVSPKAKQVCPKQTQTNQPLKPSHSHTMQEKTQAQQELAIPIQNKLLHPEVLPVNTQKVLANSTSNLLQVKQMEPVPTQTDRLLLKLLETSTTSSPILPQPPKQLKNQSLSRSSSPKLDQQQSLQISKKEPTNSHSEIQQELPVKHTHQSAQEKQTKVTQCIPAAPLQILPNQSLPQSQNLKCYHPLKQSQSCPRSSQVVQPQHNTQAANNTSTLPRNQQVNQSVISAPIRSLNQANNQDKLNNSCKLLQSKAEEKPQLTVVPKNQTETQKKLVNPCPNSVNLSTSQEPSCIPPPQKRLIPETLLNNQSLKHNQLQNNSCNSPKVLSHSPNSEKPSPPIQPRQHNTAPKLEHKEEIMNLQKLSNSKPHQPPSSQSQISPTIPQQSPQEVKPPPSSDKPPPPLVLNSTMFKWEKSPPLTQDQIAIVTPKLGKTPHNAKLVPNQTTSKEGTVVPNLDKVLTNLPPNLDTIQNIKTSNLKAKIPVPVEDKVAICNSPQEAKKEQRKVTESCQKIRNLESPKDCPKKNFSTFLELLDKNEITVLEKIPVKVKKLECNNNSESTDKKELEGVQNSPVNNGLFLDFPERNVMESVEDLPKNFNLTENIRTYIRRPNKKQDVNKDCIKVLIENEVFNACRNVNSSFSIELQHSNVQNSLNKNKELKVVLFRLPSNTETEGKCTKNKDENPSIKQKCDRGKTPPKTPRQRKSSDKSENKIGKAPNLVQNHNMNPLQDINPRVTPKTNLKSCCDLNKSNSVEDTKLADLNEKSPIKKGFVKSVLAKIPGLNDFQMIRPLNVNHIVNVVQVSGTRTTQNVPIQNTQTSTQVTPHIQRIGQPRVSDQKPEPVTTTTVTTVTISNSTTSIAKTTTTQPSTLINILSQQVVRPTTTQGNIIRRQTPFINILSQQVVRPSANQKTTVNATTTTTSVLDIANSSNQVKPFVAAVANEPIIINQVAAGGMKPTASIKSIGTATSGQGGTILQFICKSSLPKFQQAFGKTIYQNSTESVDSTTMTLEASATTDTKKAITKTVPVNVQPLQGSVIYSRQVPVGQAISLIPQGTATRQVFRITSTGNPEQLNLVKDSVIQGKMSALLAAALQGRQAKSIEDVQINCDETTKLTLARPTLVQNARIVKPVQLQLPTNVVRAAPQTNLSSTTLEQLREFDMVYKQVKERSSSTNPGETSNNAGEASEVAPQRISVTYLNQLPKYTQLSPVVVVTSYSSLQPAASPALSVTSQRSSSPCLTPSSTPTLPKIATKNSKGKTFKNTTTNSNTKSSPIPKPQQKPQEDEHTTQRIFDILAEYAEQLRNSPDLNNKPAPRRRSNPPTNPNQSSKRKKSSSAKKAGQSSSTIDIDTDDITVGSEDSSGGGIIQLSVTDDEQSQAATTVTTPESTENSNPSISRPVILAENPSVGTQSRNVIIADSSVGEALKMPNTAVIVPGSYIMPVSMVKGAQQIAVVSGGSKILATVPARSGQNMLLFQSFTNQNRKGAISAVKYSTIQPISGISSQSLAGVSAQPPVILPSNSVATAVALGQPLTLKKISEDRDTNELVLTISPPKDEPKCLNDVTQPDSSTSVSTDSSDIKIKIEDQSLQSDNSNEKIFQTYQKSVITNSVGTSVIATSIKQEDNGAQNIININLPADSIKTEPKSNERMQSVLVTACSSNGPMLSHSTPRYRKTADTVRTNNSEVSHKEELLHNGEKSNNSDQKTYRGNITYYSNKAKKISVESHKMDSEMQKQAAIERELRLQKSLSEECEDLGVDEPSTSDLFPEADLLFDSNHSPSFDQTSQDIIKRAPHVEIKEEVKASMNLFSDDETSSSLRTDLFEYVEYQTVETALDYQTRQLMNGNTTGTESGSSGCEDNTLLPKCATMSDVTLNSPISPEMYQETSLNKYKFKYTNRKRGDRAKPNEFIGEIVSSSEDTIGSMELGKSHCEDDTYKVVHLAITKNMNIKEEDKCELHCDEDRDSPSGRGARRSVRKLCSCCNGSQDGNISRKRPHSSRPQTPAPHKKAFLTKKR